MATSLLLAMQAAALQAAGAAAVDFDLARHRPVQAQTAFGPCASRDPDEILVCAPRLTAGYPYAEMERRFATVAARAEVGIGGGAAMRAYVEQRTLAPGMVSNRLMVGLRLGF